MFSFKNKDVTKKWRIFWIFWENVTTFQLFFFVLGQFATTLLFFGKTLDSYFKIIINKIYPLQKKLHINDWFLKL